MASGHRRQFATEVFPAELAAIADRRERLELPVPAPGEGPSAELGLVGLALSGGGIRSASAGLGILQALAARDILPRVDYVSTVSGGSLIGCAMSASLTAPDTSPENARFPLGHDTGTPEKPAVRYIRNHRRYLAPGGLLDALRLPATLLRGVIDNLAMLVPVLVAAVFATEVLSLLLESWGLHRLPVLSSAMWILFVALALLQPVVFRMWPDRFTWGPRNRYGHLLTAVLLAGIVAALALPLLELMRDAAGGTPEDVAAIVHQYARYLWMAAGLAVVLMLAGAVVPAARPITRALALTTVGALGYAAVFGLYLLLCLYHVDDAALWDGRGEWLFIGAGVAGAIYAVWLTNPNGTGQFFFFRDRLSRAFVIRVDARGHARPVDELKLSSLRPAGSAAPYHLINATINLQGDPRAELAGREADFFCFSRHFVGGPSTGFARAEAVEAADPRLNVGTALGVSGAGLAPNMGVETVRPLVFLFALVDLRLDYWLPNPSAVRRLSTGRLRWLSPLGPAALLKEAFGRLDARGAYVNVSDGGQIENLGVYELLRRRCRWILAVDASQDATMSCGCLADVLRYARIDLGITIDIDVDPLRAGSNGCTAAHWVVGRIDYGGGETGRLVYLKLSMTGDEPESVREYRSRYPAFPQQSSANQFFTEDQFEAYRALGEHIARGFSESEEAAALLHSLPRSSARPQAVIA
jgi:hypothetical protein